MVRFFVFVSGAVLMSLEMLGSRFLAPQYGNSIVVWASLISVFLAGLSLGYWIGGLLADRLPTLRGVAGVLTAAGAAIMTIPSVAPLLFRIAPESPREGALVSAMVLFLLPTILLGSVSPYAIRIEAAERERLGRSAGQLYAVSTIGSIFGTIITAFWLIPFSGVSRLTVGLGVVLLCLALFIMLRSGRRLARLTAVTAASAIAVISIGVFLAEALASRSAPTDMTRTIVEKDTLYQHMIVTDREGVRVLRLDHLIQTASAIGNPRDGRLSYTSYLHLPMVLDPGARDVLFIGLGGGTLVTQFLHDYPQTRIDVAELDPDVVAVARRYFGVPENGPRLRVFAEDGRRFLQRSDRKYDVIVVDAFHRDFVPFHLTTREFFTLCRDRLNPRGMVAMNIIGAYGGTRLSSIVGSVYQTTGLIFPERYLFADHLRQLPSPRSERNCILIAGLGEQKPQAELDALRRTRSDLIGDYLAGGPDLRLAKTLSDDFAPVEDMLR